MNILPKKSWHVRNKDNVARVRRDEAQARDEQRERERRALLAQQEARTDLLRKRARRLPLPPAAEPYAPHSEDPRPVDLFRELVEEGKGPTGGNREYEEEKRQAQEQQEKALGVLTYLGQSAAEAQTRPPWYQLPPEPRDPPHGPTPDQKAKNQLDPLRELKRQLGQKKGSRGEEGGGRPREPSLPGPRAAASMAQLRAERLRREAAERSRAEALLWGRGAPPQEEEEADERRRRYNSQFHPELARAPRELGRAPRR